MKIKILCFVILLSAGCSSRPVLYPNQKLKRVGKERSQQDIDRCLKDADDYLDSPKAKAILKSAGKGSLLGGAVGLVSGLFTGDLLQGIGQGAAFGATVGAVGESISPDQLKRSYVNQCLAKKNYQIIGWD